MTKYGMVAAIWIASLGSVGGGGTVLWNYVTEVSEELGELRAEVKYLRVSLGDCVETDGFKE